MSAALGRLRRQFGDELLVRVGSRYELTPPGRGARQPGGATCCAWRGDPPPQRRASIRELDTGVHGHLLRLRGRGPFPLVQARLRAEAPDVKVRVVSVDATAIESPQPVLRSADLLCHAPGPDVRHRQHGPVHRPLVCVSGTPPAPRRPARRGRLRRPAGPGLRRPRGTAADRRVDELVVGARVDLVVDSLALLPTAIGGNRPAGPRPAPDAPARRGPHDGAPHRRPPAAHLSARGGLVAPRRGRTTPSPVVPPALREAARGLPADPFADPLADPVATADLVPPPEFPPWVPAGVPGCGITPRDAHQSRVVVSAGRPRAGSIVQAPGTWRKPRQRCQEICMRRSTTRSRSSRFHRRAVVATTARVPPAVTTAAGDGPVTIKFATEHRPTVRAPTARWPRPSRPRTPTSRSRSSKPPSTPTPNVLRTQLRGGNAPDVLLTALPHRNSNALLLTPTRGWDEDLGDADWVTKAVPASSKNLFEVDVEAYAVPLDVSAEHRDRQPDRAYAAAGIKPAATMAELLGMRHAQGRRQVDVRRRRSVPGNLSLMAMQFASSSRLLPRSRTGTTAQGGEGDLRRKCGVEAGPRGVVAMKEAGCFQEGVAAPGSPRSRRP